MDFLDWMDRIKGEVLVNSEGGGGGPFGLEALGAKFPGINGEGVHLLPEGGYSAI